MCKKRSCFLGTKTLVLLASFGRNTDDITMGLFGQCIFNEKKIRSVFFTDRCGQTFRLKQRQAALDFATCTLIWSNLETVCPVL